MKKLSLMLSVIAFDLFASPTQHGELHVAWKAAIQNIDLDSPEARVELPKPIRHVDMAIGGKYAGSPIDIDDDTSKIVLASAIVEEFRVIFSLQSPYSNWVSPWIGFGKENRKTYYQIDVNGITFSDEGALSTRGINFQYGFKF